jgi:hypothetical protein
VKRVSVRVKLFFSTKRSILEGNQINVLIMGRVSFRALISFYIQGSMLVKIPIHVISVEKEVNRAQVSFNIRQFILEKNPYQCSECGGCFRLSSHLLQLGRSHTKAVNLTNVSARAFI